MYTVLSTSLMFTSPFGLSVLCERASVSPIRPGLSLVEPFRKQAFQIPTNQMHFHSRLPVHTHTHTNAELFLSAHLAQSSLVGQFYMITCSLRWCWQQRHARMDRGTGQRNDHQLVFTDLQTLALVCVVTRCSPHGVAVKRSRYRTAHVSSHYASEKT